MRNVIEATGWRTELTGRDFPQHVGMLCPIPWPGCWTLRAEWIPSGQSHDIVVFAAPDESGFSAFTSAGPRFGWGHRDLGYVLDLDPAGRARLYRCDGDGVAVLLDEPRTVPPARRRVAVEVTPAGITVTAGDGPGQILFSAPDKTYRGDHLFVMRRIRDEVDPLQLASSPREEESVLKPAPFSKLSLHRGNSV